MCLKKIGEKCFLSPTTYSAIQGWAGMLSFFGWSNTYLLSRIREACLSNLLPPPLPRANLIHLATKRLRKKTGFVYDDLAQHFTAKIGRSKNLIKVKDRKTHFWGFQIANPTSPFTILKPQNLWIGQIYVVQERRSTDFKAPKLWKGSSQWSVGRYLHFNSLSLFWRRTERIGRRKYIGNIIYWYAVCPRV